MTYQKNIIKKITQISIIGSFVFVASFLLLPLSAVAANPACGSTITTNITLDSNMSCPSTGLIIGASNIILDGAGFTITGPGNGVGITNSGSLTNVTIKNFILKNYAIGIGLWNADFNNLQILNNDVSGGVTGMMGNRNLTNSLIDGNNAQNSSGAALDFINVSGTTITNNNLSNSGTGLRLLATGQNTIGTGLSANNFYGTNVSLAIGGRDFVISDLDLSGATLGKLKLGTAITNSDSLTNVTIKNINASGRDRGIGLWNGYFNNLQILNNDISGGVTGIQSNRNLINSLIDGNNAQNSSDAALWIYASGTTITNNNLSNSGTGLRLISPSNTKIFHNNIFGNTVKQITSDTAIELSFNNEGNFWGRTSAPYFIAGTDSNRLDVVDSYPYSKKDAWKIVDTDNDGIADDADNCPSVANPDQLDTDADALGNACDLDDDNDGIVDEIDAQPLAASDSFDDRSLSGTTYGVIAKRSDWTISTAELAQPEGVLISLSGSGTGPVRIVSCNNNVETALEAAGESAVITCGSTTVLAKTTANTIELRKPHTGAGGKAIKVKLSAGQTVTIGTPITAGSTNTEPILVEILDEQDQIIGSGSLIAGEKLDIEFVNNSVVLTNLSANPISFTMNGVSLTLNPNETVTDYCLTIPGDKEHAGCPVADKTLVELHIIDQAKLNLCPEGGGSCKLALEGALVKAFDRNNSEFQAKFKKALEDSESDKQKKQKPYDDIFKSDIGLLGRCTTDASGSCLIGEAQVGDYLVISRYEDKEIFKTVYTALPKGDKDFKDTNGDGSADLATKTLKITKQYKKDGKIEILDDARTVIVSHPIAQFFAFWKGLGKNLLALVSKVF